MIYTIKNEYLTAKIDGHGAELVSLVDKDNIERLHQKDDNTWNRTSPVLFPTISRFKDFTYKAKGQEYKMPMHGFFRDMDLSPTKLTNNEIEFSIKDDENTLKMYPYHFTFSVKYTIFRNKIIVSFNIKNTGKDMMYYMIGGHPGFNAPLYKGESYEDYYVKFQQNETSDAMQVVDGYLASEFVRYLDKQDTIKLAHNLFIPDAIVLTNLKSSFVDLLSTKNDKKIRFHFKDFKILAIWSLNKEEADYVCFEPWNGIQHDFVIDIEKMGVFNLKPNKKAKYSYTIECF